MNTQKWLLIPVLLAGIASAPGHAAQARSATTRVSLRYEPWELTSPTAASSLLQRIGVAALETCGASPFSLAEFKAATRQSSCWRAAVDDAVRRIGDPLLSKVAGDRRK